MSSRAMKCGWVLVLVLVQTSRGHLQSKFLGTLDNATGTIRITENCQLFLKSLVHDLSNNGTSWQEDQEGGSTTMCYDIESVEGNIKAKCYFKPLLASNGSDSVLAAWMISQELNLDDNSNITRYLGLTNENSANDYVTSTICLPTSCTNEDVRRIFHNLIGKEITVCRNKDVTTTPNIEIIIAIVILSWFLLMMAVSTVYDLYCYWNTLEPLHECLVAFSVHRNGKRIFQTNTNSSDMLCLNGIRVISMTWVIVLHTASEMCNAHFSKSEELIKWESTWGSMLIRSGTLAVDSFLAVGGTLLTYTFMSKRTKLFSGKFNISYHYLHRYIRLTPPLAAAVLVSSTVLGNVGSPKFRKTINTVLSSPCRKYWWSALLYIQNYVNVEELCLSQTWYLSADMQLYLISPLILFPLLKRPKLGVTLLVLCIPISIVIPFCIAYEKKLVGVQGIISHDETIEQYTQYLFEYYFRTHARSTPWFIGMVLGYILFGIKHDNIRKPKIRKEVVILLWAICLTVMLVCVYGGHTLEGPNYNRLANSSFIALSKPAWSLCMTWVIFACALGYGGPINWILSNSVNQILITFTYSMYILHLPVLLVMNYSSDVSNTSFSIFSMLTASCTVFFLSFGISIFWVLAFESPMTILEKHILLR